MEAPALGPQVRQFSVAFPHATSVGPVANGDAPDGQASSATVELNRTNLTKVSFSFTFTDNYQLAAISPAGATFRVTSPEGNTSEAKCPPGGSTRCTLVVAGMNLPPDGMIFTAEDQQAAQRTAAARYPATTNGSGQWTLEIVPERAYVSPIHPVRSSITWSMTSKAESYSMEVAELQRS